MKKEYNEKLVSLLAWDIGQLIESGEATPNAVIKILSEQVEGISIKEIHEVLKRLPELREDMKPEVQVQLIGTIMLLTAMIREILDNLDAQ